jgi:hypothetical protein
MDTEEKTEIKKEDEDKEKEKEADKEKSDDKDKEEKEKEKEAEKEKEKKEKAKAETPHDRLIKVKQFSSLDVTGSKIPVPVTVLQRESTGFEECYSLAVRK